VQTASWIVASMPTRRRFVGAALEHMRAAVVPVGWKVELVVGIEAGDVETRHICEQHDATVVEVKATRGGPKRNAAIAHASGTLLLIADDDDMVSPMRMALAVTAFQAGYKVTSSREFRYMHLPTGLVVRWRGRPATNGGRDIPIVGAARNIARTTLVGSGGYADLPSLLETDLQARISRRFREQDIDLSTIKVIPDASSMWTQTINVQHGGNVWKDRQELTKGQKFTRGRYTLEGEGHWSELADFPASVVAALGLR